MIKLILKNETKNINSIHGNFKIQQKYKHLWEAEMRKQMILKTHKMKEHPMFMNQKHQ